MEREAQRMNRLVSDLLSLSQVEAVERMRPNEVVDDVLDRVDGRSPVLLCSSAILYSE